MAGLEMEIFTEFEEALLWLSYSGHPNSCLSSL
jgi:hypothetical protein